MQPTIATVNGAPITAADLQTAMQSLALEQFHCVLEKAPAGARAELRELALERLIARELIFQAALAEGVVASEEEVAAEQQRILRLMGNPADVWERLAAGGMDRAAFGRMVRKDVTVDTMTARVMAELEAPGEAAIEQFYRQHPDKLRSSERVRVSHLLLDEDPAHPEQTLELANRLRAEAEQGDFAALARLHSACPSAPGGGDLGFIRREDVDPSFADAAFGQAVGEVGPPVRTPFGTHLILVTERELPAPLTLDEARPKIVGFLQRANGTQRLKQWVEELRQAAEVVVVDAAGPR